MRFQGTCYRAHDPKWSHKPLSGAGAAVDGRRFNPKGVEALYLSLSLMTAIKEANQGLAHKIEPYVICSYDVICDDIADLRTEDLQDAQGVARSDIACAWSLDITEGRVPPSWSIAQRLIDSGHAGILVPSFVPSATQDDQNLVLWNWSGEPPHQVTVYDPSGRLPKNQLSWD